MRQTRDVRAAVGGTWGSSALAWAGRSPGAGSASEILGARGKTWPTPCSSCTLLAQPPTCGDKTQRKRHQGCVVNHNLTVMTSESGNVSPDQQCSKKEKSFHPDWTEIIKNTWKGKIYFSTVLCFYDIYMEKCNTLIKLSGCLSKCIFCWRLQKNFGVYLFYRMRDPLMATTFLWAPKHCVKTDVQCNELCFNVGCMRSDKTLQTCKNKLNLIHF